VTIRQPQARSAAAFWTGRYGFVGTTIRPATISACSESTRALTASGNERLVVLVVDPLHAILGHAQVLDAGLEAVLLHGADGLEHRGVDALDHRREDEARRLVVLVGIDADRQLVQLARASNTPSPVEPDAWKMMSAPAWYSASARLLAFGRVLTPRPVLPAYSLPARGTRGSTACTPAT